MIEVWKVIPCYKMYETSSLGRIRSWKKWRNKVPRILKGSLDSYGYVQVNIATNVLLHRLICMTFNGMPPDNKNICRHLDGNKANNRPDNLAWGSVQDNMSDMVKHGNSCKGVLHRDAKLSVKEVKAIRLKYKSGLGTHKQLAKMYNTSTTNIGCIIHRQTWKHI